MRYQPRNLMLFGTTPGPKEFDSDELQFFVKNYVDDLIRLYEHGINVKTPNFPDTLCKVCGFGGHHKEEGFCTRCHIKRSELQTKDAMSYDRYQDPLIGSAPWTFCWPMVQRTVQQSCGVRSRTLMVRLIIDEFSQIAVDNHAGDMIAERVSRDGGMAGAKTTLLAAQVVVEEQQKQ
ncbi:hypothetical protein EDB19DRAFT_2028707 [Suillus lakei]|nr:hypothetical protein EDB19DRAFT_2028707 [Suillus lakei]